MGGNEHIAAPLFFRAQEWRISFVGGPVCYYTCSTIYSMLVRAGSVQTYLEGAARKRTWKKWTIRGRHERRRLSWVVSALVLILLTAVCSPDIHLGACVSVFNGKLNEALYLFTKVYILCVGIMAMEQCSHRVHRTNRKKHKRALSTNFRRKMSKAQQWATAERA